MVGKLLAIALFAAACGTNPLPAGAVCKATSDCEGGLDCLDVAQINGSTCMVVGKACSKTCTTAADCASLGSNFQCFAGCGSAMTCGATGP